MCLHKVEEQDDIQNVPASLAGGSEVKEDTSPNQNHKNEERVEEASSVKINTSELPPHLVLGMLALSPTMVSIKLSPFFHYEFSLMHLCFFPEPRKYC